MVTTVHPLQTVNSQSLTGKLQRFHDELLCDYPDICRLACAIYDTNSDILKTFINSTREGHAIAGYEVKLHNTPSLLELANQQQSRVIDDISRQIHAGTPHSDWLLEQGYLSSFTIPIVRQSKFLGFIFIDSTTKASFTEGVQRDLIMRCNGICDAIANELSSAHLLVATASAIRSIAHLRDFETGMHLTRMAELSKLIAHNLPAEKALNDEIIEHIYLFSPLHDIGKIGIPDSILLKQGKLTTEERKIIQTHVQKGVDIIDAILAEFNLIEQSDARIMRNIIAFHHEYLDGSGYPFKLKGEQIPIEARVVTVADIFDALTHERPYKKPWTTAESLAELDDMVRQGKLDKDCVWALNKVIDQAERIVSTYRDVTQ
ncbi:phosphohydrolase [Alteromonas lipolytica]|uniref:Phosphohydrolase n=1 Tax=Alteromonas lipolytica TaxID=1856405 RepID=A0A1E8FD33_9ALTE|nr:phosphohydrolase [Alteromonas lipolytica]